MSSFGRTSRVLRGIAFQSRVAWYKNLLATI
jgi:hypothetical protein